LLTFIEESENDGNGRALDTVEYIESVNGRGMRNRRRR
jgi:hypothetical protein